MQGGYGVVLKIGSPLAAVAKLLDDVEFPEQELVMVDAVAHDNADGYLERLSSGLRKTNPFTVTLGWSTANHADIQTQFALDTATGFSIEDPNGDEVIAFSGFISKIGRVSEAEGLYKADVEITPTGKATIT